jgi:4-nitrophenyl phosphatase
VLLDGDGVLWKSNLPLPGFQELFQFLEDHEIGWALLTNNNGHPVSTYLDRFESFGIKISPRSIFTSSTATASYLVEKYGSGASLHVIGMEGLIQALKNAGFQITVGVEKPPGPVSAVVAGMDLDLTYPKVILAMRLILNGAEFVATNTDSHYPRPDGIYPATGMVIGALQGSTNVMPYVVGKPYPAIYNAALKELNSNPEDTLMVGDRLDTDILGANRLGIDSAAVLTGTTSREEINTSDIKPGFVFEDLPALIQALVKNYGSPQR